MPRLPISLVRKARDASPLLVPLLQTCRNLPAASNELRWLKDHVCKTLPLEPPFRAINSKYAREHQLEKLCLARGRGVPLQYLLGTEYFGDLELACEPGVLIPRPETAEIVTDLARRLCRKLAQSGAPYPLRVLDLCTGTGCMSLLLHTELQKTHKGSYSPTSTLGIDVSIHAIRLARRNRARLGLVHTAADGTRSSPLTFTTADIFDSAAELQADHPATRSPPSLSTRLAQRPEWQTWDIVLANPPYISTREFNSTAVERSVRRFEPRSALVPPFARQITENDDGCLQDADTFYPRIIDIAKRVGASVVLMEVGGDEQATRVREFVQSRGVWDSVEIWHDGGASRWAGAPPRGQARAVVCWG